MKEVIKQSKWWSCWLGDGTTTLCFWLPGTALPCAEMRFISSTNGSQLDQEWGFDGNWWPYSLIFSLLPELLFPYLVHASTFNNKQISVTQTSFSVWPFMPGAGVIRRKSTPSKMNHRWEAWALHQVLVWGLPPAPAEQSREGKAAARKPCLGGGLEEHRGAAQGPGVAWAMGMQRAGYSLRLSSTCVIESCWFLLLKELHKSNTGAKNVISKQITPCNVMKSEKGRGNSARWSICKYVSCWNRVHEPFLRNPLHLYESEWAWKLQKGTSSPNPNWQQTFDQAQFYYHNYSVIINAGFPIGRAAKHEITSSSFFNLTGERKRSTQSTDFQ